MSDAELEKMKKMEETKELDAKIPWCNLGYTVKDSKEKCPLGGCWKYRCFDSKLNAAWHSDREKWQDERYGRTKVP